MPNAMPWEDVETREMRWVPYANVAPYVLLAILAGISPLLADSARDTLLITGLCVLAAVWVLCLYTLRPAWRVRPVLMAVFFVGFLAILLTLVVIAPWFGFLTPAGYFFAFGVLRWPWRVPGVAAVAVAAGIAQASGITFDSGQGVIWYAAIILINAVPMCAYAWIDWTSDQEREERRRALTELSEANARLEATLTENAALHERLLTQAREAGVHDERQRMAGEIHDTLAQGLTGIITQLQAAEQAAAEADRWRRHLSAATDLARESLREARRSVHALRPEPLRDARLAGALAGVAQSWSRRHGIAVEVTTTGTERPMSQEAELALLRTAQEALANVAAHAGARRVGLTLSYLDESVALDVRDDGCGFDPALPPVSAGGYGLVAMRQRIEGLSGTLQVESEPRSGTAISAAVPA
ncbi:histidine kinase [Asanoa ishikariensis]|uniref:Oxygen sensor histidine kinase NreB n=1 Tax=Asanoa ishikariensis TaxID=137265 RepID=A0A1H3RUQ3_9ACTN|nr:sensor histidine kinase [Asanoa ishikariensis]GIF66798.1 histidine kinase [Asanoa ishikariensis]SDZ29407.1 Signal transduction histidine kinase [Asanoa ishikariensis]